MLISPVNLSKYVPYTDATGAVNLNNQNLYNIDGLGVNGSSTLAAITGTSLYCISSINQLQLAEVSANRAVFDVDAGGNLILTTAGDITFSAAGGDIGFGSSDLTTTGEASIGKLSILQTADSEGWQINGFDDRITTWMKANISSAGTAYLAASGAWLFEAGGSAIALISASEGMAIYRNQRLSFGFFDENFYFTKPSTGTALQFWNTTGADTQLTEIAANGDEWHLGKLRVGSNVAPVNTLDVTGTVGFTYRAITAIRTLDATDYQIDCTANTFTVTLPTAVGITGRIYSIKNSGTGVITVDGDGTETIDGELTQIVSQKDNMVLMSNGSDWIIR